MKLIVPVSYKQASKKLKKKICGGCGPGKWGDYFVPDNLLGLDITEACNIHDWMYHCGETLEDKIKADRIFMKNMVALIVQKSWFDPYKWKRLTKARLKLAAIYYRAVDEFGEDAFLA